MKLLAHNALDAYRNEVDEYLAKRFLNTAKSSAYSEAPEYANTTYPDPPAAETIFVSSK